MIQTGFTAEYAVVNPFLVHLKSWMARIYGNADWSNLGHRLREILLATRPDVDKAGQISADIGLIELAGSILCSVRVGVLSVDTLVVLDVLESSQQGSVH